MARKSNAGMEAPNLLIVEGKDDQHVIKNLLKRRGFPEDAIVIEQAGTDDPDDSGGYQRLRQNLGQRIELGNHKRIGVVVDADTDCEARWTSLYQLIIDCKGGTGATYSTPPVKPVDGGAIILPDNPEPLDTASSPYRTHIGIWVMPDNRLPGAIEEFLRLLVPMEKAVLWKHAEDCVTSLPIRPRTDENWNAKARIHSYLAWQTYPGAPLGAAITEKYLNADSPEADSFVNWVRRLLESQ